MDAEPPPRTTLAAFIDPLAAPLAAGVATIVLFGLFVAAAGKNPLEVYRLMAVGAFGSWFSWQNTLLRASPLLLTALCTALPAQMASRRWRRPCRSPITARRRSSCRS